MRLLKFFMNDKASRLNEWEDTVVSTHIIFVSYATTCVNGGEGTGKIFVITLLSL